MNIFRNLRLGNRPLTIGLVFGVILTLVSILFGFIAPAFGQISSYVTLAIIILAGLFAGRRASSITGKIGSGVLAGFVTGLVSSIITGIITMISLFLNIDAVRQQYQQIANTQKPVIHVTNGLVIQEYLISLALSAVLTSLFCLAGGSIGGFLGKRRAQLPPSEEYQEAMFVPPPTSRQNDSSPSDSNDANDDSPSPDENTLSSSQSSTITRRRSASRARRNDSLRQRDKSKS